MAKFKEKLYLLPVGLGIALLALPRLMPAGLRRSSFATAISTTLDIQISAGGGAFDITATVLVNGTGAPTYPTGNVTVTLQDLTAGYPITSNAPVDSTGKVTFAGVAGTYVEWMTRQVAVIAKYTESSVVRGQAQKTINLHQTTYQIL